MPRRKYFSQYKSPNIIIVPTVTNLTSKIPKLDDTPHKKIRETISSSKIITSPVPEINKNNVSRKITNPVPMFLMREPNDSKDINNVRIKKIIGKETILVSRKIVNPESVIIMKQAEESEDIRDNNMEIEANSKDVTSSSGKNNNLMHEVLRKQSEEPLEQKNEKIENLAYNKKVNTSWASNYMESIGQTQKKSTRIALNCSKTHKSQKIEPVSSNTNEEAKTKKQTSQTEACNDKHKQTPGKSSKLPQKPRKCKKIKLEITVVFKEPTSSSDSDSNDHEEGNSYAHADMSFLEDINVDEIVKSLCENTSTKKEDKSYRVIEEINNNESNNVAKQKNNRLDGIEEQSLIPNENIKKEPEPPLPSESMKEFLQSKNILIKNNLHDGNIKANEQLQTRSFKDRPLSLDLKIKPDDAKVISQTSSLVTWPNDAEKSRLETKLKVAPDDKGRHVIVNSDNAEKSKITPRPVINPHFNKQSLKPVSFKSSITEPVNENPISSTLISSTKSKDLEVETQTTSLMHTEDETTEKDLTTTLDTKSNYVKQKPVFPRLSLNSESTDDNSPPKSEQAIKPNDTNNSKKLTTIDVTELDYDSEKPLHGDHIRTPCLANLAENIKEKRPITSRWEPELSDIMQKPQSPRLDLEPENAEGNPQLLTQSDKDLAVNLERILFLYLKEKFTVILNIHLGKYSTIYKLEDSKNIKYAVKILNNTNDSLFKGIKKEKMLMTLQAYIPRENLQFVYTYNGFSMKGYWCFLMDFYPKNLHQALQENDKPFHIDKVQDFARQLVSAARILRNNYIVHSDIKPSHILLNCANDRLKLCGFDASYYKDEVKILPNIGTINYRAPEIIIGYSAGYSIDVWAIAVVMYEMVTNMKLFPDTYNNDLLYKQISTFGGIPSHMVQKSLFRDIHFRDGKFLRKIGKKKILVSVDQFKKKNTLHIEIFQAYRRHWMKSRNKFQLNADLEKTNSLIGLLEKMLMLSPSNRITIEHVYANPFIFEYYE